MQHAQAMLLLSSAALANDAWVLWLEIEWLGVQVPTLKNVVGHQASAKTMRVQTYNLLVVSREKENIISVYNNAFPYSLLTTSKAIRS